MERDRLSNEMGSTYNHLPISKSEVSGYKYIFHHHKQCQWCPRINRCSNGLDRHRQEWLHNGCEAIHTQSLSECSYPEEAGSATSSPLSPHSSDVNTFGMDASIQPYGEGVCMREVEIAIEGKNG